MSYKEADVQNEYLKNPDLQKEDVQVLRQWVEKQPHLPELGEFQLIYFLQSCYCKIEATKRTIDAFFSMKTNCPDFFSNRDPNYPSTKKSFDCGCFSKLANVSPEGYNVLLFTFMDDDANNFIFVDQVKIFDMCMRLWLHEDGTSKGLLIVLDVGKLSFAHLTKFGVFAVRDILYYLQDALPVRLKGLHFVNAGATMDKLMLLMKPFLKKELSEMLFIHKDVGESVYKFIPKRYLPKEYGGEADSLTDLHAAMKKKLLENTDFFVEEEKQVADESKRERKRNDSTSQEYGADGSFKKLEID